MEKHAEPKNKTINRVVRTLNKDTIGQDQENTLNNGFEKLKINEEINKSRRILRIKDIQPSVTVTENTQMMNTQKSVTTATTAQTRRGPFGEQKLPLQNVNFNYARGSMKLTHNQLAAISTKQITAPNHTPLQFQSLKRPPIENDVAKIDTKPRERKNPKTYLSMDLFGNSVAKKNE